MHYFFLQGLSPLKKKQKLSTDESETAGTLSNKSIANSLTQDMPETSPAINSGFKIKLQSYSLPSETEEKYENIATERNKGTGCIKTCNEQSTGNNITSALKTIGGNMYGQTSMDKLKKYTAVPSLSQSGSSSQALPSSSRTKGSKSLVKPAVKYTPLEQQFLDLREQNPGVVLLVECGYKYRFFGDDARVNLNSYLFSLNQLLRVLAKIHTLTTLFTVANASVQES